MRIKKLLEQKPKLFMTNEFFEKLLKLVKKCYFIIIVFVYFWEC